MKRNIKTALKNSVIAGILCLVSGIAFGTARTYIGPTGTGAWITATNWSPNGAPANGDDLTIGGTSAITFNNVQSVSLNSLNITNSSSSGITLTYTSAATLTITTLSVSGNLTTGSNVSLSITNGTVASGKQLSIGSGDQLTVNGTLTINGSGPCCANTPMVNSGTITVPSGGLVNYTGSGVTGCNMTVAVGGELRYSGSGTIITSGPTINGTLTLGGSVSTGSGSFPGYGSSSLLQYTGTSSQTANYYELPSSNGPYNIIINNSSGVYFNTSIPPSPVILGTLTLQTGTLYLGTSSYPHVTFQTGNTPIVKVGGNINPGTTATLVFGTSGNTGGNVFTLPDNLFTTPNVYTLTVNRTNPLTLNNQNITNYFLNLPAGLLILGTGNFTSNSISAYPNTSFGTTNMVVTSSSSGYLQYVFPAGATSKVTLPLGEMVGTTEYTPSIMSMDSNSVSRTIGFRLVDATNPNMNVPTTPADYITRYWNTTVSPSTGTYTYHDTLYYNGSTGDVVGTEGNMVPVGWNGINGWNVYPGGVNTSSHYLAIAGATETTGPFGFDFTGRTGAAALASPVATAGSGATCNQITANWNSSSGATAYLLDVSTNSNFSAFVSGFDSLNVGNVTTYNVTGLTAGQTYYYRVRATNGSSTSGYSGTIAYATLAATPATPVASAGSNAACNQITANWNTSTNATTYFLDVATDNSFTNFVAGFDSLNVGNVTTYNVPGLALGTTYYYRVRASNACGASGSSSVITYSTVGTIGTASYTGGHSILCVGATDTFTAAATGASSIVYSILTGGASINSSTGIVSNITTAFTVRAILSNSCSIDTVDRAVTVNTAPSITVTNTGPVCAGINLGLNATGGTTYNWSGPNGFTNTSTGTPVINNATTAATGTYNVTVTNSNGCTATGSTTATVNASVIPTDTISASPAGAICTGTNVTFTPAVNNGGANPVYHWYLNGAVVDSGSTYSNSNLGNGDSVRLVLTSNAACASPANVSSNTVIMTVNSSLTPSVSISSNPSGPICAHTNVVFTPVPSGGGASPTYQWFLNGNTAGNGSTFSSSNLNDQDTVKVIMTSSASCASVSTATSTIIMSVGQVVTPSVIVSANPSGPICSGTNVTFSAAITNGGTNPGYQWTVNGIFVSTDTTFSTHGLNEGDSINVLITSNAGCASPTSALSPAIYMTVYNTTTPTVTIGSFPVGAICSGSNVQFTATALNGGIPTYEWLVNSISSGTGYTFTTNALNNGDSVKVVMTSTALCTTAATDTSNVIIQTVNTSVTPQVTIASNPQGAVCAGNNVTFTATPVGNTGGSNPSYNWLVDGIYANSGSIFNSTSLNDGDTVVAVMTSSAVCTTTPTGTSNPIVMSVFNSLTPTVSVTADPTGTICFGTNVQFTASPSGGGSTPAYQWQVNGNNTDTGAVFNSSALHNNDQVKVIMTSSASCAVPNTATSFPVTMSVTSTVTPRVTISSDPAGAICQGTGVTFTAAPFNGGSPTFEWWLNGQDVGGGSTFSSSGLNNNDQVSVVMTSTASCASASTAADTVSETVNTPVFPTISQQGDTLLSSSAQLYQWYEDTVLLNGQTGSTLNINHDGNYTVITTDGNGCTASATLTNVIYTGVEEINARPVLTIYPNPVNDVLNIKLTSLKGNEPVEIKLFDVLGKLVSARTIPSANGNLGTHILMTGLSEGLYLLQIKHADWTMSRKVTLTR